MNIYKFRFLTAMTLYDVTWNWVTVHGISIQGKQKKAQNLKIKGFELFV